MSPGAVITVACWGLLVAGTLCGLLQCWLDNRDRERCIGARGVRERLASGAARDEAFGLQLDELRSLPTGKPRAW